MITIDNKPMRLSLSAWRKARGINQEEMAKRLRISFPTYTRWEKNPGKIPMSKALEISTILMVDMNNIIFLADNDTKSIKEA